MKVIDCPQDSEEWHRHRCGIPTVSEFGRFITAARGDYSKQAQAYIADLIVEEVEGPPEHISSYWMDRGITLEDEARDWYAFDQGVEVQQTGIVLNEGAGWSPDGLVGETGAIEIKCPKPATHVKYLMAGTLPDEYKAQVHGALIVGEKSWIDFVSYCPGFRPLRIPVLPGKYTEKVRRALSQFHVEHSAARALVMDLSPGQ